MDIENNYRVIKYDIELLKRQCSAKVENGTEESNVAYPIHVYQDLYIYYSVYRGVSPWHCETYISEIEVYHINFDKFKLVAKFDEPNSLELDKPCREKVMDFKYFIENMISDRTFILHIDSKNQFLRSISKYIFRTKVFT